MKSISSILKIAALGSFILFIGLSIAPALLIVHADISKETETLSDEHKITTNGVVTLTFDDGYQTIYDNALPILDQHHLQASLFMITGINELQGSTLMNLSELVQLKLHGWDIDSHSVDHHKVIGFNISRMIYEIVNSKQWIIQNGLGNPLAFAYPCGRSNYLSRLIVYNNYKYGRTMAPGFNNLSNRKDDALKTYVLWGTPTNGSLNICEQKITEGISKGKWIIITFHGVTTDPTYYKVSHYYLWTTTETLNDFTSFLINNSIPVETFSQLTP